MTISAQDAARAASAAALAAAAVGALAACSSESASGGAARTSDASGTWTERGDYATPGGTESVTVKLTAKDGTVTAVEVSGSGDSPNARQYQAAFGSGIAAEVVGEPLATLQVGAVSGSSLTGNGFNAAVEKIRADAA